MLKLQTAKEPGVSFTKMEKKHIILDLHRLKQTTTLQNQAKLLLIMEFIFGYMKTVLLYYTTLGKAGASHGKLPG